VAFRKSVVLPVASSRATMVASELRPWRIHRLSPDRSHTGLHSSQIVCGLLERVAPLLSNGSAFHRLDGSLTKSTLDPSRAMIDLLVWGGDEGFLYRS